MVSKQCVVQFCFDCKLRIGDGVIETWFADSGKQLVLIDGVMTASGQYWIYVTANANCIIGELIDEAEKTTKNGCSFILMESTWLKNNIGASVNGVLHLYSSIFHSLSGIIRLVLRLYDNDRAWNCMLVRETRFESGANFDMYNVVVSGAETAHESPGAGITIEKLTIYGAINGVYMWASAAPPTLRDLVLINCTNMVGPRVITGDWDIIDADTDSWAIGWGLGSTGVVNRQYSFNLLVKDSVGDPLDDVTVTLIDKDDNVDFSVSTGGGGTIVEQIVTRGYYDVANDDVLQEYGPHKLTLTKAGYRPLTIEAIVLGDPVDWTLELLKWDETLTLQQGSMLVTPRLGVRKVIG